MPVGMPKTNAPRGGGNVGYVRDDLRKMLPQYELIKDCIDGEVAVKLRGDRYLPRPDATNTSAENVSRYVAYITRAVFYNATRRTLGGLLGEVFAIDPVIEIPTALDAIVADATGGGVTLIQQAIQAAHNTIAYSRCGVFVDYPQTDGKISQLQIETGDIRPTIAIYDPWDVINWRTVTRGAKILLSLVVLKEKWEKIDDGFEIKFEDQWRVLRLDNEGLYRVEIWRNDSSAGPFQVFEPLDSEGNRFNEIPFHFIGAKNNDEKIDPAILYDLASLNMAHYRNSADNEESSFTVGQPTYVFAGLTKDWVRNVLNSRVETGSRTAVALPEKGSAQILQPDPNTMPREGMEHKERQMVALGAKLVENRSVQRTATETTMDQRTENSILSAAANNVSDVFTWALQFAAQFVGAVSDNIRFEINTQFAIQRLSPEEQQQLVANWQANALTTEEMRDGLRNSGIATEANATAIPKLEKQAVKATELEIKKIKAKQPAIRTPPKAPAKAAA